MIYGTTEHIKWIDQEMFGENFGNFNPPRSNPLVTERESKSKEQHRAAMDHLVGTSSSSTALPALDPLTDIADLAFDAPAIAVPRQFDTDMFDNELDIPTPPGPFATPVPGDKSADVVAVDVLQDAAHGFDDPLPQLQCVAILCRRWGDVLIGTHAEFARAGCTRKFDCGFAGKQCSED